MQSDSPSLSRSSSAIRAPMRALHESLNRAQSARLGTRPGGSPASSAPISSSVISPARWANTMNATRRTTARA